MNPYPSPPAPVWPRDPNNLAKPLPWKHGSISLQAFAAKRLWEELKSSRYDVDLAAAAEELRLYIERKRRARPGPALPTLGLENVYNPESAESQIRLARYLAHRAAQGGMRANRTAPTATTQVPAESGSTLSGTDSETVEEVEDVEEVEEDAAPLKKENRPANNEPGDRRLKLVDY